MNDDRPSAVTEHESGVEPGDTNPRLDHDDLGGRVDEVFASAYPSSDVADSDQHATREDGDPAAAVDGSNMDSDPALEDRSRVWPFLRSLRSIHDSSVWMIVVRHTVSVSMGSDIPRIA
jgi:hypothetical protein